MGGGKHRDSLLCQWAHVKTGGVECLTVGGGSRSPKERGCTERWKAQLLAKHGIGIGHWRGIPCDGGLDDRVIDQASLEEHRAGPCVTSASHQSARPTDQAERDQLDADTRCQEVVIEVQEGESSALSLINAC